MGLEVIAVSGDEKLITAGALAESLDVSVETVWRYTREGRIPHVQLGGRQYRYRLQEVPAALGDPSVRERPGDYQFEGESCPDRGFSSAEEPGCRLEMINGQLIKEPAPSVLHQRVSRRLMRILDDYFEGIDPEGEVFCAPLNVALDEDNVLQPDLLYVSGEQKHLVKRDRIDGPPGLVVKLLSDTSAVRDRIDKMRIYRAAGVPHYWLVTPEHRMMHCMSLADGLYGLIWGWMLMCCVRRIFPGLRCRWHSCGCRSSLVRRRAEAGLPGR